LSRVDLRAEPPFPDVLHVVRNLRERDRVEIFACEYGEDPVDFARRTCSLGAFQWGAYLDGKPVAVIGAVPKWPNVWQVFAFGTDDWPKVVLTLTRHARRFMVPAMFRAGAHRLECAALETHADSRRWLERCFGAKPEVLLAHYGKNGENFVNYVVTREPTKPSKTVSPRVG
jgi:hypothetical protein